KEERVMVRGVQKRIIEVKDPQSECFERAFLIVKENFREEKTELLQKKGGEFVRRMGTVVLARRKAARIGKKLLLALLGAAVLLLLCWAFFGGR
ncbi:MAG: hypothetical protein IIX70_08740, partial [Oscillospiraceae bacterium]|nr:hypothetical protein [Oscillospiraceae bacterium]